MYDGFVFSSIDHIWQIIPVTESFSWCIQITIFIFDVLEPQNTGIQGLIPIAQLIQAPWVFVLKTQITLLATPFELGLWQIFFDLLVEEKWISIYLMNTDSRRSQVSFIWVTTKSSKVTNQKYNTIWVHLWLQEKGSKV